MFVVRGAKAAGNLVEETGSGLISTLSGRRKLGSKSSKKLPVVKLEIVSDTVWYVSFLSAIVVETGAVVRKPASHRPTPHTVLMIAVRSATFSSAGCPQSSSSLRYGRHIFIDFFSLRSSSERLRPKGRSELNAQTMKVCRLQGKLDFEVHWIAYQLQPLAPPEGVPKAVFMEQKFKGQAQYLIEKKQVGALLSRQLSTLR